jgi:vitamin B12 transporter
MDINVDKATTQGVEAFVLWRPIEAVTTRVDYTYTDAENDTARDQLLRRPKDKLSVDLAWQATSRFQATAELLYVGSRADGTRLSFSPVRAPGYATVNLTGTYALTHNLALFGRVTNLTDQRYQDPIGFLQPRIGVVAGAKASF